MTLADDPICVLIADDEAPMRMRLRSLLAEDEDVGRVIEAESGIQAAELTARERPDLVFLDVQMPGMDGLQVIRKVGADNMPLTIFITAYDRFAIQAFEAEALDYLLKPFGNTRYEATMARAKKRLGETRAAQAGEATLTAPHMSEFADEVQRHDAIYDWLAVKDRDTTRLVSTRDIEWIEACGTYVTLHVGDEEILHRTALNGLAAKLDPRRFVRTHRSAIVNLESIAVLQRRSHGEFDVVLRGGKRVMLSRKYKPDLEALLGQSL